MNKKLRISILFNEPVVNGGTAPTPVNFQGPTKNEADPLLKRGASEKPRQPLKVETQVDLSEVGVVEEMQDIKAALDSLGYKTTIVNVNSEVYRLIDYLRNDRPDIIFNLVECVENESLQEMNVAGLYDLLKIPYTGAGPLALGTALNKPRVKEILTYHGIRTPDYQVFRPQDRIVLKEGLAFPLIVKPSHEDGSVGISDLSIVYNPNDLRKRVRYIHTEFQQPALVEQYIIGRELNVAILGSVNPQVLPISEIDFTGMPDSMHKIVSYEAKWMHGTPSYEGTRGVCPAKLSARQEAAIKRTALTCFHLIGCRDYARVDFRLTPQGVPYVLEVNPNPDISDDAGFARSARVAGYTFPEAIGKIIESALERWNTK
ncbi:MAG TPA: ATP-grasp domain-containing protein [Bacteroidota bacterium]|nr:ATP-grasp domain-containing protein [Bacteroidota bacterium]